MELKYGNRESLIEDLIDVGLKVRTQNGRVLKNLVLARFLFIAYFKNT